MKRPYQTRPRQRAFTLVETLLAATVTALTAAAGATLIYAVANATSETRDSRNTQNSGLYTLSSISKSVREARVVGDVESKEISLWLDDTNEDDVVNLSECGVIVYSPSDKDLRLYTAGSTIPAAQASSVVATTTLQDPTAMLAAFPPEYRESVVWAEDVKNVSFKGYPDDTETRIVSITVQLKSGEEVVEFQTTASPKASADYLFNTKAKATPQSGSTRIPRATFSRWDGYSDLDK